jgi:hypothetical protein
MPGLNCTEWRLPLSTCPDYNQCPNNEVSVLTLTLAKTYFSDGSTFQREVTWDVSHTAVCVQEAGACSMRVHTLVVHLCGCVWVTSMPCTHNLALTSHIVITQCLPPDNRLSLTHKPHCLHDVCNMDVGVELLACCAVPAFHQVH